MVPRTLASHLYIPGRSSSGGRHTPRREPQSCRRRCRLRCFSRSQVQARDYDAIRGPTDLTFPGLREDPLRAADVTSFRPTGKRPPRSAHAQPGPATGKPRNRKPALPNRLLRNLDWQDWWAGLSLRRSQSGVGVGTRPTDPDHVYRRCGGTGRWGLCKRTRSVKIGQLSYRVFNVLLFNWHLHWSITLHGLLSCSQQQEALGSLS